MVVPTITVTSPTTGTRPHTYIRHHLYSSKAPASSTTTVASLTSQGSGNSTVSSQATSVLSRFTGTPATHYENYSTFCGLCRAIRRQLDAGGILSQVDIGHWDDHGHTTDPHKRKWAGKLRKIINARSVKLKDCGAMVNAAAGHSFISLGGAMQDLKGHEIIEVGTFDESEKLSSDVYRIEEETWDAAPIYPEGRLSISEGEESVGSIPISLDVRGRADTNTCMRAAVAPAPGEPLNDIEKAKMEEMEGKSDMVFFGEFDEGQEWSLIPVFLENQPRFDT